MRCARAPSPSLPHLDANLPSSHVCSVCPVGPEKARGEEGTRKVDYIKGFMDLALSYRRTEALFSVCDRKVKKAMRTVQASGKRGHPRQLGPCYAGGDWGMMREIPTQASGWRQ